VTAIRVSLGTAVALGLSDVRADVLPTTAYLMVGERCVRDCAFCAQARSSTARADALSRVTWPLYDEQVTLAALATAAESGCIRRACFQATASPGTVAEVARLARAVRAAANIPVSTSARPDSLAGLDVLLEAGVGRVGLSLDAASPTVYRAVKGGDVEDAWTFLAAASRRHPGRIATHLIVGLGESERDMVAAIQRAHDLGVTVGLFAFTPVRGTGLTHRPPPALEHYRRMQVARYLIVNSHSHEEFRFDDEGRLIRFGLAGEELGALLADGVVFQTSGCPDCNRPYYNERPGGVIYNYARPLTPEEIELAIAAVKQAPGVC